MAGGVLFFFIALISAAHGASNKGDSCVNNNIAGSCQLLQNCAAAFNDLQKGISPQICTSSDNETIVCCKHSASTAAPPVPLTRIRRTSASSTSEYISKMGGCGALPASLAAPKTGQRAWDKCLEYQESLVYPCTKIGGLIGEVARQPRCHHNGDELLVGGNETLHKEFPHMAILGYGDDVNNLQWLCGGALISDRFILTAGHCTESLDHGVVSYVRVGTLRRDHSSGNRYKIQRIIPNGNYHHPRKYDDIALLETETAVPLDQYTVPACIHVGNPVDTDKALVIGWQVMELSGNNSDVLNKVIVSKYNNSECTASFPPNRRLRKGFDPNTQLCYGDRTSSEDTCQVKTGGPLQIKSKEIHCMYTIIGIASFGKHCRFPEEPMVYTRVANYLTWIEDTVWPVKK